MCDSPLVCARANLDRFLPRSAAPARPAGRPVATAAEDRSYRTPRGRVAVAGPRWTGASRNSAGTGMARNGLRGQLNGQAGVVGDRGHLRQFQTMSIMPVKPDGHADHYSRRTEHERRQQGKNQRCQVGHVHAATYACGATLQPGFSEMCAGMAQPVEVTLRTPVQRQD